MRKTWLEKYRSRRGAIIEVTERKFADIPAGTTMVISTPEEIDREVRKIPYGQELTVHELRDRIARKHNVEKACPITTGIFLRIASEVAVEDLAEGSPVDKVMPFWRIVQPNSTIGKKLACGQDFIIRMREKEGLPVPQRIRTV